jgi:hypothetical protein
MTAPFGKSVQMAVAPESTVGNSRNTNIHVVQSAGTVSAVTYSTVTAITGANTNTRSVSLVNKGQAGAGTTTIATLQFNSGVNTTASDEKTITLSGTAADLVVAAGDVLQWQSTAVGTGIADPGGLVNVTIAATYA